MSKSHEWEVDPVDGGTLIRLPGPRLASEESCAQHFLRLTEAFTDGNVYLDCVNVECLSSLELGTLVRLHRRLRDRGRQLVLCGVKPLLHEVFTVTRLDTVFPVHPKRATEDARADLASLSA